MLSCPFCNTDLTQLVMREGRCPTCGGLLAWGPAPSADEEQRSNTDSLSFEDILKNIVARGRQDRGPTPAGPAPDMTIADIGQFRLAHENPDAAAAPLTPPPPSVLPPAGDVPPPIPPRASMPTANPAFDQTLDSAEALEHHNSVPPPAPHAGQGDTDRVREIWGDKFAPQTPLTGTLKAPQDTSVGSVSDLRIRPHRLRHPGDPAGMQAEYELVDIIGKGGVGVVYAAKQASIDRTVALKMLKPELEDSEEHRDKFLTEAVVTGDLDHPNIVPIYDLGANDHGALFYSMKRVRGTPWSQVIGIKSLSENLEILLRVADAIAFAHARGVVHRDLKPENIMLGDFGEVLVMDWGIAMSMPSSNRPRSNLATGLGGTPAYMAPEMAVGPLDRIGPPSDVYLLGAILYEIVTGKVPHTGADVMSCIRAAARNEIQPTDKTGELIDLAFKAMATEPKQRFATVPAFQAAIRLYESHSESIVLTSRAEDELSQANRTQNYQDYSRALFGFQEGLLLWPENKRALQGEETARSAYAQCALEKEDFDLGLSLLDPQEPKHAALHKRLVAAQYERTTRQSRLRSLRRVAAGLALLVFLVVTSALLYILKQNSRLDSAIGQLQEEKRKLTESETSLRNTTENLLASETSLKNSQAGLLEKTAALQKNEVVLKAAKQRADNEAAAAKAAQQREAYASYLAQIGISSERISANAFLDADRLLALYESSDGAFFRNWEWGYLQRLCRLDEKTVAAPGRVEGLASSADGATVAAATRGNVIVWNVDWKTNAWTEVARLPIAGAINAVAVSADGRRLAAAGTADDGPRPLVHVWEQTAAREFTLQGTLSGHRGPILNLAFSGDGGLLAAASRDETARVWSVADRREQAVFRGHFGPVWSVDFSPSASQLVTAGEDGTVRIWNLADEAPPRVFRGHERPVYAAVFSRDGTTIASAGRDPDILLWRPQATTDFDFSKFEKSLQAAGETGKRDTAPPAAFHHVPDARLAGHSAEIRRLAFSRDGRQLLSAGHDNTVRLWSLAKNTGELVQTFRGHGGWIRGALFGPEGRHLVSGGHDELIKIWNPADYEEERILRGHTDAVLAGGFSPSGDRFVTAGRDHRAVIWSLKGGEPVAVLDDAPQPTSGTDKAGTALHEGHEFLVNAVAFFPPGDDRVATSAGDDTVRIWDLKKGVQLRRIDGAGTIGVVSVSDDGNWLATGSDGKDALLWNLSGGAAAPISLAGHRNEVSAVAFSPVRRGGERFLATGDLGGQARLWRFDSADKQWKLVSRLDAHSAGSAVSAIRFTPDGGRLLTASQDNTVMQWEVPSGVRLSKLTMRHPDAVKSLDISADGKTAVTLCSLGGSRHCLTAWDLSRLDPRKMIFELPKETPTSVAFEHEQNAVILVSNTGDAGYLRRWIIGTERLDTLWKRPPLRGTIWAAGQTPDGLHYVAVGGNSARLVDARTGQVNKSLSPHSAVTAAAYSPAGRWIATAGSDGDVKFWDAREGTPDFGRAIFKLPRAHERGGEAAPINALAFSPVITGGELCATAGDDGTAKVWRIEEQSASQVAVCTGHTGRVRSVAFSPDGKVLATAGSDGDIRLWDPLTGVAIGENQVRNHGSSEVLHVSFAPSGAILMSGMDDNTARLWDLSDPTAVKPLRSLTGHTAAVTSTAISRDGKRALTGSADGTAKVWDIETGIEVLSLKRHSAEITSAWFSPDGRNILTTSLDQTGLLWRSKNISPAIRLNGDRVTDDEARGPRTLDAAIQVSDPDSPDLENGVLTVTAAEASRVRIAVGAPAEGAVKIDGGRIDVDAQDGRGLRPFGRLQSEPGPTRTLTVQLLTGVDTRACETFLRSLTWQADRRLAEPELIRILLSDGDGGQSPAATLTIEPRPATPATAE